MIYAFVDGVPVDEQTYNLARIKEPSMTYGESLKHEFDDRILTEMLEHAVGFHLIQKVMELDNARNNVK